MRNVALLPRSGSYALAVSWMIAAPLFLIFFVAFFASRARANSETDHFSEGEIRFESGDVTLSGTVLVPDTPGRKPAVALVHGAGLGPREQYRQEAEAFAREGIVTLIYDKRKRGYSQFERSYELLADDALAAVSTLRARPDVDRDKVGLWGLSEGGWVVPIAASRSEEVAFVVLVAASGVPPTQQHSWSLENQLRHQGVSGSMVEAVSRKGVRLLVGTGVFAEAYHDPVGPLEGMDQPVLALWGVKDRIEPPAESARILREALERSGNTYYKIRFFPDAEHGLRSSPDGFVVRQDLVPGYAETVGGWVHQIARGETPGPSVTGPDPQQARLSHALSPLAWWESGWIQLGAVALPILAFSFYLAVALVRMARGRPYQAPKTPILRVRHCASWLARAGLAAVLGFVGYFGYLMFTEASAVGPVVAGRSLPWLALQALAVATSVLTVLTAASWWSARADVRGVERARSGVLLAGGVVFVGWAAYWGLLVP
jgi:dienelactone hydrolase